MAARHLRARLAAVEAERDAARADAARNRWCEDRDADVVVYHGNNYDRIWTVVWIDGDGNARTYQDSDRNAAIDAARGVR